MEVHLPPYAFSSVVMSSADKREQPWQISEWGVPEVWKDSKGKGTRIAVLDTGVDDSHCDLRANVIATRDFTGSRYGHRDVNGHGTHCAGSVAAVANGKGVVGVAPEAKLICGKVLGDNGSGMSDWVADGVRWAVEQGADVISMSLGSSREATEISNAIHSAVNKGVVVIAAAGNDGRGPSDSKDRVNYPGKLHDTIAVGAVKRDGSVSDFSSRGPAVDIMAPGQDILSTWPDNRYVAISGTSMATPYIAGCVALSISIHGDFGTPVAVQSLRDSLKKWSVDAGAPGEDNVYGGGVIDPDSIASGQGSVPPAPPKPEPGPGVWCWIPGGRVSS